MTGPASPEQNAAYCAGLCVGLCGKPHSPGRPRCEACHLIYQNPPTKETT